MIKIQKTALSLAVVSCLSACGGSNSSNGPAGDTGGGTKKVTYQLCHDGNVDGTCSENESPRSFNTLSAAVGTDANAGAGPVIVTGSDGTLMMAPASASRADVWSTLRYNEMFFNPEVSGDEAQIEHYLQSKLKVAGSTLTEEQVAQFNASVAAAVKQHPNTHPYRVLAAVIDAAVLQGSLADAMPTVEQVASQKVLSRAYTTEPEATVKATWETSDSDERVHLIVPGDDNQLMVVNRWHNSVVMVDAASAEQALVAQPFAAMETAGHHVYTTDVDYVSGASEHTITHGWIDADSDTLYALTAGPREVDSAQDDSYGLFRVPLVGGQLPAQDVAAIDGSKHHNVPHRASTVTRVDNAHLRAAVQLPNGNVLAYDADAGYVRVYDAALTEETGRAIALDRPLVDWKLSANGTRLALLLGEQDDQKGRVLQSWDVVSLKNEGEIALNASADTLLSARDADTLLVIDGVNIQALQASSLKVMSAWAVGSAPGSQSRISADGTRAALVYNSAINVLNLSEAYPFIEGSIPYSGRLRALKFNGNNEIVYSSKGGELQSVSLQGLSSAPVSIDSILERALEQVSASSINHGYDLSAVIYPMDLPKTYGPTDYKWSSTVGDALDVNGGDQHGQIKQGKENVSGQLAVTVGYSFRGKESVSDAKSFDITVRAASEPVEQQLTTMTGALATIEFGALAISLDGSRVAAWATGENGNGGIVLFDRQADNTLMPSTDIVSMPDGFNGSRVDLIAWSGDQLRVVVREKLTAGEKEGDGAARILSLDTSDQQWSVGDAQPGRGNKAALSQDGQVMAMWLQVPEGDGIRVQVKTFRVADLSEIATIGIDGEPRYWALTVDNTGRHVMVYYNYRNEERKTFRNTRRYDADTDGAAEAVTVISTATYGYTYDNATDTLITGDFSAEVRLYPNAASASDLDTFYTYETARGRYDGGHSAGGHGGGRMYYGHVVNSVAYLWSSGRGVVAVDITNPESPREKFYAPLSYLGFGGVSSDGRFAISYAFDDDARKSVFSVIDLQQ